MRIASPTTWFALSLSLSLGVARCAPPPPPVMDSGAVDSGPMCITPEDPGMATACGAANITLDGNCRCTVGYYWSGSRCVAATGTCQCILGCERLYPTEASCNAGHAHCPR